MKPTDNVKNQAEGINIEEVKKHLSEKAGKKLTDDELEQVNGGADKYVMLCFV